MAIHGTLEELAWESAFFGVRSAIVRLQPAAPALSVTDFSAWERVQVKLAASQTAQLDALQALGFQLVEGEIDFSLTVSPQGVDPAATWPPPTIFLNYAVWQPGSSCRAVFVRPGMRLMQAGAFMRSG